MTAQKSYIDAILVYLLLFSSGSCFYMQSSHKYLMLVFAASFMAWLISDRRINNRFVVYVTGFFCFLLLIHFYTGGSQAFSSVIGATLRLVTAYLIIKAVGSRFVGTYINVVVFLAVISLFGYMSDRLSLFDGLISALPKIEVIVFGDESTAYEGIFYLFRFREHLERNNSIFFEPGAYQAFLNAALFMLFFANTSFSRNRQSWYILILVLTLAASLKTTDPNLYREYRRAAWNQLRREVRLADPTDIWRYTADMLYMIEEPIIREAFFPSDMRPFAVDPAQPEHEPVILSIIEQNEGPQAAALLAQWWSQMPQTFRVIRDRDGAVAGFYIIFEPSMLEESMLLQDPILSSWWQHLKDDPIAKRQKAIFCRRWLSEQYGELPSPVQAACWLDLKGVYMEMRSVLRRIYCTAISVEDYGPVLVKLGFRLISEAAVTLDGNTYHAAMLDFGPGLVDGWMAGHVRAELGLDEQEVLDRDARELVLGGSRIGLTPLEFGVMVYLHDNEGKAVTRTELLNDVWGYKYEGGSNVVDARIRSLRKKLGERAWMIETVTGVGYRFRQG